MPLPEPEYEPTPEEIAEACAKIRTAWTPADFEERRRGWLWTGKPGCGSNIADPYGRTVNAKRLHVPRRRQTD